MVTGGRKLAAACSATLRLKYIWSDSITTKCATCSHTRTIQPEGTGHWACPLQ